MTQTNFEDFVIEVFTRFMDNFLNYKANAQVVKEIEKKNESFDNIIFISLFGDIEGAFILEMDHSTAEEFLKHFHKSQKQKIDLQTLVKGYIGEFGNVLVGKIIGNLGKNFGNTFLSTPSLFSGVGMKVDLFYNVNYSVKIGFEFGIFRVSFSVKT